MTTTIFNTLVYGWMVLAVVVFWLLFFVTAPFGRHTSDTWGPTINARWGWFWMELPSPLVLSYFFFTGSAGPNAVTWIFWGLWVAHYTNRALIYPLRQRDHQKKMPVAIMGSAIFFNVINGFLNGYFLGNYGEAYSLAWLSSPWFVGGLLLFLIGWFINVQSDHILLNLRKPGEKTYKIPKKGLFRYVSCPNLLGEIVEWLGYALLVSSLPAWSFALWTWANLAPRAWAHHRWYQTKFENYPSQRKALLPFLW
jgi:protein-S-isoprenylcysteine O-methyltransferase Ste14